MNSTNNESVYLVDANDDEISPVLRSEMRQHGLLHRVTYQIVFDSQGRLLVQERTLTKDWYPGYLDFAAGGVIQFGESYDLSASRELKEELGIETSLKKEFKIYFEDTTSSPITRSWGMVYSCTSDGPFKLQKEEVANAVFMSIEEALGIDPGRVTPDTRQVLLSYLL